MGIERVSGLLWRESGDRPCSSSGRSSGSLHSPLARWIGTSKSSEPSQKSPGRSSIASKTGSIWSSKATPLAPTIPNGENALVMTPPRSLKLKKVKMENSQTASGSAHSSKPIINKGRRILKISKAPVPREKEVPALSEDKVVVAFRWCYPGEGLVSLSLIPDGKVVAKRLASVAEEFRLSEVRRDTAKSQLSKLEHVMLHLVVDKRMADEAQAMAIGHVV
ncbi:hypothetical protein LWI28_018964 [Acer negundo]|uniref:Uncharacterized protein n=1 Tax=Acer negundo TaxID=4023 RepID=A0AAD5P5P4_ACENE|nr:hypothetical protein LWI28_018964 [Acer negundo]